ncbi:hypothetical protein EVAR_27155_1 [Eumeta japonica]|uniref:Uncharacterized protein n=1 Tax=Eumeta variegata TaxID=151549 RepID=A0A4C1W1J7_EUMVA|nr:hypothetical protein EVAR_27155_1 [Eumeta japonica]
MKFDTGWALGRDVVSLYVPYRVYYGDCFEELFNLISAADFRLADKYHQHHIHGCRSTIVRFMDNFLPYAVGIKNDLPSVVYPTNFEKQVFKKRGYSYLKGRQCTSGSSGDAGVHGRR